MNAPRNIYTHLLFSLTDTTVVENTEMFVYCVCVEGGGVDCVYISYDEAVAKVKELKGNYWVEEKRILQHHRESSNPLDDTVMSEIHSEAVQSLQRPFDVQSQRSVSSSSNVPPAVADALSRHPNWPGASVIPESISPAPHQFQSTSTPWWQPSRSTSQVSQFDKCFAP